MRKHLEIARRQFERDEYARSLGIVLDDLTESTIRMHMPLRSNMMNFYDRPHGAVIYSLADAAFSVLGNNRNTICIALDCSISYHASPDPKATLNVEGETLSMNRRTAAYIFKVYAGDGAARTLIATMKSVSYRTGRPIDPGVARE
jgi:acyl-CoA thioesterase